MSDIISKANFKKHVKALVIPEGFTSSMEVENLYKDHDQQVFVIQSDTVKIKFDQTGSGHTIFLHNDNWLCFDRRGIEDSFYHLPWSKTDKDIYDLNAIVAEQIERIAEYKKEAETFIMIPAMNFTVTPKRLEELKKQLRRTGLISFMPSGFGTGYMLMKNKTSGSKRADPSTEKFFDMGQLYISTFDAD